MKTSNRVLQTIDTYDQIADRYAEKTLKHFNHEVLDDFIALTSESTPKILDVGCASGRDAAYFHSLGCEVTGIDLSEGLLKIARKNNPEVSFRKMDMRQLEFEDSSFDGVFAMASLHHLEPTDILPTLQEFYRVLKPNGVVFISIKTKEIAEDQTEFAFGHYRYYTYLSLSEFEDMIHKTHFSVHKLITRRSRERDIDWVWAFLTKSAE